MLRPRDVFSLLLPTRCTTNTWWSEISHLSKDAAAKTRGGHDDDGRSAARKQRRLASKENTGRDGGEHHDVNTHKNSHRRNGLTRLIAANGASKFASLPAD